MDICEAQKAVDAWIDQFEEGYWSPLANLARLTEEVGELAREINHAYGEKPKRPDEAPGKVSSELGDILWVVICLANSLNIDLNEAFSHTLRKVTERDGNRYTRKPGAQAPKLS